MERERRRSRHTYVALTRTQRVTEWLVYSLLAALPLMLGTVTTRPGFMQVAHLLVLAAFALFVLDSLHSRRPVRTSGLGLVPFALAGYVLLTLLPLPPDLLAALSPETARLYHRALESLGLYGQGQWRALSADTPETALALASFLALGLFGLITVGLFAAHHRSRRLAAVLGLIAFGVAAFGFAQKAFGLHAIFGSIPVPRDAPYLFSVFVNPNHLAAFLVLLAPLQLALALKSEGRGRKLLWGVLTIVSCSAVVLTLSRAGILSLVGSLTLFAFLVWRRRQALLPMLIVQSFLFAAILAAAYLAFGRVEQELATLGSLSAQPLGPKPWLWYDASRIIAAFPLFGTGAESFKIVYPLFKTQLMDFSVLYPENLELHLLAELGWPVTLALAGFVAAWVVAIWRNRELSHLEIAALCGFCALLIHNQVDFNYTAFAIAAPAFGLLAILAQRHAVSRPYGFFREIAIPRRLLVILGLTACLGMLAADAYWLMARAPESETRVQLAAYNAHLSDADFSTAFLTELERHPLDAYLYVLAAERGDTRLASVRAEKLAMLRKAKQLDPTSPLIDRQMGRLYAASGNEAAAVAAFHLAMLKPVMLRPYFESMRKAGLSEYAMIRALPARANAVAELASFLIDTGRLEAAAGLVRPWLKAPGATGAGLNAALGRLLVTRGDYEGAFKLGGDMARRYPEAPQGYFLLAQLATHEARHDEALAWSDKALACAGAAADLDMLTFKTRSLIELKRYNEAEDVALKVHALSWRNPKRRVAAFVLTGEIAAARGQTYTALKEVEQALLIDPRSAGAFRLQGELYEKMERPREALSAYEHAVRDGGSRDAAVFRKIRLLKDALEKQAAPPPASRPR